MSERGKLLKGVGLLLTATILWGAMFPIAKDALAVIDAFYLNALRYGVTATVFALVLVLTEGREAFHFDGRVVAAALFGAIGFAGFSLFVFIGLGHTPAVHGAIIMAMQPMLAALVRWLWHGQRPVRITLLCIATAFVGVVLVVTRGEVANLYSGTGWGDLLIVVGALAWVVYTLAAVRFPGWSPLRYTALTCLTGEAAILAATAVASATGFAAWPSPETLEPVSLQLVYLVVFASIVAVLAWNSGIRKLDPLGGMLFINIVPITAFAIGVWQGQHFSSAEVAGAALVIGALFANNLALKYLRAR